MDKYGLKPITRQKGISQSMINNTQLQSQLQSPQYQQNQFRIKQVANTYQHQQQPLSVSGLQIKQDNLILDQIQYLHNYRFHIIDLSQTEQYNLKIFQNEIAMIQQEINELDKDQKIRNNNVKGEFNKGHINTLKRWLLQNSTDIMKSLSQQQFQLINDESQLNPDLIVELIKVSSKDECIKKLFHLLYILDSFLFKFTEYLTVSYIKYEDIFNQKINSNNISNSSSDPKNNTNNQMRINQFIQGQNNILPNNLSAIHLDRFNLLMKSYSTKINDQMNQQKISHNNQGVQFNLKNDCPKKEIKTIQEFLNYIINIKQNTIMNNDYVTQMKQLLNTIDNNIKKEIETKEQQLNKTKEINFKQEDIIQKYLIQIDQLDKQVIFLNEQNNQNILIQQQKLQQQENEHIKQIEIMQNDLTIQITEAIQEKVVSLNKTIQDQENELKKLQKQYEEMFQKLQNKQNQLNTILIDQKNTAQNQEIKQETQKEQIKDIEQQQKIIKMIDEIKDDYSKTIEILRNEVQEYKQKYLDMKINNETTYQELLNLQSLYHALLQEKQDITLKLSAQYMSKQEFSDTFENALKEEFKRMKNSFEGRIQKLNQDIINLKKEKNKSLFEMKSQLDRELETKNLLMKKLSLYVKF